ncbi:MAG: hypothetical protein ACI8RP_000370 [Urechidicola sp.]
MKVIQNVIMRSQLESIRPVIQTKSIEKEKNAVEYFQNLTLRPILKFQNDLILSIFRYHLEKHKIVFHQLTDTKQNEYVEQIIHKDRKIHHVLLGLVIGHFTEIEYETYIKHERELNRRIMALLIQRLQNEL